MDIFTNFTDMKDQNQKRKQPTAKKKIEVKTTEFAGKFEDEETAINVKAAFGKLAMKHDDQIIKNDSHLKSESVEQRSAEKIGTGQDDAEKDSNESVTDTPSIKKSGSIFYISIFSILK